MYVEVYKIKCLLDQLEDMVKQYKISKFDAISLASNLTDEENEETIINNMLDDFIDNLVVIEGGIMK